MTRPEPGTKELVWAGVAAAWAADVAVCLAALPRIPPVIARLGNRQAGATLSWIGLVLMAAAGDAIRGSPASARPRFPASARPRYLGARRAPLSGGPDARRLPPPPAPRPPVPRTLPAPPARPLSGPQCTTSPATWTAAPGHSCRRSWASTRRSWAPSRWRCSGTTYRTRSRPQAGGGGRGTGGTCFTRVYRRPRARFPAARPPFLACRKSAPVTLPSPLTSPGNLPERCRRFPAGGGRLGGPIFRRGPPKLPMAIGVAHLHPHPQLPPPRFFPAPARPPRVAAGRLTLPIDFGRTMTVERPRIGCWPAASADLIQRPGLAAGAWVLR
jgi:hypothetical protein